MPKLVNGHEVMTSQEWMQLGYPVFVAAALEEINTDHIENGASTVLYSKEDFAAMSIWDQLDVTLDWNGIIGFTSYIVEAVRALDKLDASKE